MISQLVSLWKVFLHLFARNETVQYPDKKKWWWSKPTKVMPYLAPRYRGRIILTRDPDGEERCVACNLCAVV